MTITEPSADSARPDETESQRRWMLAMQDAQRQILAKKGVRVSLSVRTTEQTKEWVQEATERRLTKYVEHQEAIDRNRHSKHEVPVRDTNPAYPEWAARRYHGD